MLKTTIFGTLFMNMFGRTAKEISKLRRFLRNLNVVALFGVISVGVGLMSSPADDQGLIGLPELELGTPAPRTLRSPRELSVRDAAVEQRLRKDAMDAVMPVYDMLGGRGGRIKQRLDTAFSEINRALHDSKARADALIEPKTSEHFMRTLGVYLKADRFEQIARVGFEERFKDAIAMVVQTVLEQRITDDKNLLALQVRRGVRVRYLATEGRVDSELTLTDYRDVLSIDQARSRVDALIAGRLTHLDKSMQRAVAMISKRLIQPNLVANPLETERRVSLAGRSIKPNIIQIGVGDIIFSKGERVSERDKLVLSALLKSQQGENPFTTPLGSVATILFLIIGLFALYRSDSLGFLPRSRDLAFVTGVYLVTLMILWVDYRLSFYAVESMGFLSPSACHFLVPIAWGVILTRIVLGFKAAAALLPLVAITAGWLMDMSLGYTIYALMGGIAGATMKTGSRPRRQIWLAGFWCGLWQAVTIVFLAMHEHVLAPQRVEDVIAALVSGLLASILVSISIPIIEVLFGYTTSTRLEELANLNHPLLRDLLVQAPATYHHSIIVGAMAQASAKRVSANPLLAKVSAYYHDVGKLEDPGAYLENRGGVQEMERLSETEARHIRNHVASSLKLGAKHRLGHAVLEIIAQHHGNSRVGEYGPIPRDDASLRPFSLEPDARQAGPIKIEEFKYAGPKPLSKEAGLVLLADSVEASVSRHAQCEDVDDQVLQGLVHQVIGEVVASGQLDECELSLKDIYNVGAEFVSVLARSTQRISRPPGPSTNYIDSFGLPDASAERPN